MAEITPKVGDYAVIAHRWDYEVAGPISRVTAQKVFYPHRWRQSGESQAYKDGVMFAGPKEAAELLAVRLKSSKALMNQDEAKARERHNERVREAVAKAIASTEPA